LVEGMNAGSMVKELKSVLQSKLANDLRQLTLETAQILFNEEKVADDYIKVFNHLPRQ